MAQIEAISEEQKRTICEAAPNVTDTQLARDLGLHRNTIRKYRRAFEAELKQATQRVLERRVEQELPNALEALGEALNVARERMLATKAPDYIRETRATATALLDRLGIEKDDDPLKEIPDAQVIEELTQRGVVVRH